MIELDNSPEERLDEMEASSLSHKQFRVIIIRMLNTMKKDIETIKKNQSETSGGGVYGVEGLNKKEKGLLDIDNSVVMAERMGV